MVNVKWREVYKSKLAIDVEVVDVHVTLNTFTSKNYAIVTQQKHLHILFL
jgi:hypothetical protein